MASQIGQRHETDCEVRNEGAKKIELRYKVCVKFKSKIEGRQNYRKNGLLGFVLALQENILMCCCSSSLDSPGLGPSSFAPIAELNI